MDKLKLQFNRLIITLAVIDNYMIELPSSGKNPAYTHPDIPGVVFMQYSEKGSIFFTALSMEDYEQIKGEYWSGTNNYVSTCRNGKTLYLHRELCPKLQKGQFAHHRGSKFNNHTEMLEAVTPAQHDQHRTYCGDLVVDTDSGGNLVLSVK